MKFSARNVLRGKVKSLKKGPINSEVTVELPGGLEIVATVTTQSAENLGLKEGSNATALIIKNLIIMSFRRIPYHMQARSNKQRRHDIPLRAFVGMTVPNNATAQLPDPIQ
jgi:molybdopterin-binding protein